MLLISFCTVYMAIVGLRFKWYILLHLHQLSNYLFFSSLIAVYHDALHTRWLIGWCRKAPQSFPPYRYIAWQRSGRVCYVTYRLLVNDNFTSNIAVVPVPLLHTVTRIARLLLLVASCLAVILP
jgi:hypothetical protein